MQGNTAAVRVDEQRKGQDIMNTMKTDKKCRKIRGWLSELVSVRTGFSADWVQNHIATCPRCQRRFAGFGKVMLAFSVIKAQPHNLDLLMRANTQAIGVLKHGLRNAPRAAKLRKMLPEPKILERCGKYERPFVNAAACIAVLVLMKIGVFSSMAGLQTRGQQVVKHYYAGHLGNDSAEEIFNT
jgi:hypothetical protein